MITDWDDAYANGAYIFGAAEYPPKWEAAAADFRAKLGALAKVDLPYGGGHREHFDLFRPEGKAKGLCVFVHGGYWRAFDKSLWSHLAAGPLARGWAVAMPSYTLAPTARISAITNEVGVAITAAAAMISGPIRLTGHSAGGHLVTRMLCENAPLSGDVAARIENTVSISGVHDLRPLLQTALNDELHLDAEEAAAESPALLAPRRGARLTCWVGADERPEFIRQNALLANVWTGLGAETACVNDGGKHHFDVIDGLSDPSSPLCAALLN
jgi:arylformamidase